MYPAKYFRELFHRRLKKIYSGQETDQLFFIFLENICQITKTAFFLNPEQEICHEKFGRILQRLEKNEPWQYITGETEFAGLKLAVNHHVLIPRPETEELIYLIKEKLCYKQPGKILDIGSGSGAIALALKKFFPSSEVVAWDYKEEILNLISKNAVKNRLDIQIKKVDILNPPLELAPFDLIVSNPPYVLPSEKREMKKNVLDFEPHEALFVPETDPVLFYKQIIDHFHKTIHGSYLFFELNPRTAVQVKKYAHKKGFSMELIKDLTGKIRFGQIINQ